MTADTFGKPLSNDMDGSDTNGLGYVVSEGYVDLVNVSGGVCAEEPNPADFAQKSHQLRILYTMWTFFCKELEKSIFEMFKCLISLHVSLIELSTTVTAENSA